MTSDNKQISEAARLVKRETDRMRLHYAAREQQAVENVARLIVTIGAEILQDQYGLTVAESADWVSQTLTAARERIGEAAAKQEMRNEKTYRRIRRDHRF